MQQITSDLPVKLEWAGSGNDAGYMFLSYNLLSNSSCFIDLQDVVYAHLNTSSLCKLHDNVRPRQLRLFSGHGHAELTSVDLHPSADCFAAWAGWCRNKLQQRCAEPAEPDLLVVAFYSSLDLYKSKVVHGLSLVLDKEACNDKACVLAAVSRDGSQLKYASPAMQDDDQVVACAVKNCGHALKWASERLQKQTDLLVHALPHLVVENFGGFLCCKHLRHLRSSCTLAMQVVQANGMCLCLFHPTVRKDKEVVLCAVRQQGLALQFASPALWRDMQVVKTAVQSNAKACRFVEDAYMRLLKMHNPYQLLYVPEALQQNMQAVLDCVSQEGRMLEFASSSFKQNRHVVLSALRQNGMALQFASAELQADKQVVLIAVRQNGMALQFACDSFKSDTDVVVAAVSQTGKALKYAAAKLQADKAVVLQAVRQHGTALKRAHHSLQNDEAVVVAAVRQDGKALKYARSYRKNKDVILIAVTQCGMALRYAQAFKNDKSIALAAAGQNGLAISVCDDACHIEEVVKAAVMQTKEALRYAKVQSAAIALAAAECHGQGVLQQCRQFATKKLVFAALAASPSALADLNYSISLCLFKSKEDQLALAEQFVHCWPAAVVTKELANLYIPRFCVRIAWQLYLQSLTACEYMQVSQACVGS